MPTTEKVRNNTSLPARVSIVLADGSGKPQSLIKADGSKSLPSRVELLQTGVWRDSWKGTIVITLDDLNEIKQNFDLGIGLPGGGAKGAAVDYKHEDYAAAAFWFKSVEIEGESLYATDISWTEAGGKAVMDGEYSFISPSFYPKGRGGYEDPENTENVYENVLVGAGLTNIPFFKGLSPVMASASFGDSQKQHAMFILASNQTKEELMNLDEIRAKSNDELSDAEKDHLAQNQDQLSTEEKVKFGFESADDTSTEEDETQTNTEEDETQVTQEQKEAAALQASVKAGTKVVVDATKFSAMESRLDAATKQLNDLNKEKVTASVDKHVARGAIKADQRDRWVSLVEADAKNLELLEALPENALLEASKGTDKNAGDATGTAAKKIDAAAKEMIKNGEAKNLGDAYGKVLASNAELKAEYEQEVKGE